MNRLALLTLSLTLGLSSRSTADIIYGATGAGGNSSSLYTINPTNGAATLIGAVTVGGNAVALSSISYNPIDGFIYGSVNNASPSNANALVSINPTNGNASLIGPFAGGVTIQSVAFDSGGTLYGYAKAPSPEGLYTLSLGEGTASRAGLPAGSQLGFSSSGNGLAIDALGTVYLAPGGASGGGGQPNAKLFTVNTTTGIANAGPAFTGAPLANSQMKAMAFDSMGTMYGLNFIPGGSFVTRFVTIDPMTGAISDVGSTQNGMVGLAIVPAAVPEPGSLILGGIAAIGLLVRGLRKKRGAQGETSNLA